MSRPWPNARSSTLLSPSPPSPSLFLHNFCFSPLEFSPTCPSRTKRNLCQECQLRIESDWKSRLFVGIGQLFFLKGKNEEHISLLSSQHVSIIINQTIIFHFLKEKKIYVYIYILLPNFFDSKIERIAKSHPIPDRSKDVRRADSLDCYAWMEQKSRFALRSRRTR